MRTMVTCGPVMFTLRWLKESRFQCSGRLEVKMTNGNAGSLMTSTLESRRWWWPQNRPSFYLAERSGGTLTVRYDKLKFLTGVDQAAVKRLLTSSQSRY